MIEYTTPTIKLTVMGLDLTAQDIRVTLEQGSQKKTWKGSDLTVTAVQSGQTTNTNIDFTLSQEESSAFEYMLPVAVQVNWISQNGVRAATEVRNIPVMRNLLDEVIEYGD